MRPYLQLIRIPGLLFMSRSLGWGYPWHLGGRYWHSDSSPYY